MKRELKRCDIQDVVLAYMLIELAKKLLNSWELRHTKPQYVK